jgi:hypothetical protein
VRLFLAPLVVVAVLSVGVSAGLSSTSGRSISIVKTSTAANGIVTVTVKINGWKMYPARVGKKPNKPGGGHWHIFVDGKYNNASASAATGKTVVLKSGSHKIFAELANNDHSLLKPPVVSRTVTVKVGGSQMVY